jgi:hypothetical protein
MKKLLLGSVALVAAAQAPASDLNTPVYMKRPPWRRSTTGQVSISAAVRVTAGRIPTGRPRTWPMGAYSPRRAATHRHFTAAAKSVTTTCSPRASCSASLAPSARAAITRAPMSVSGRSARAMARPTTPALCAPPAWLRVRHVVAIRHWRLGVVARLLHTDPGHRRRRQCGARHGRDDLDEQQWLDGGRGARLCPCEELGRVRRVSILSAHRDPDVPHRAAIVDREHFQQRDRGRHQLALQLGRTNRTALLILCPPAS